MSENTHLESDTHPTPNRDPLAINQPARILVVDDESDLEILFRQIFRRELRDQQMWFHFVPHGRAALDCLTIDPCFDMVLSDIRMPKMDGLTLLTNICKLYPTIKVVMVTAYGDMENIRKAMNAGAFDFISKPIQYKDLKATIEKTLDHVAELKELHRTRREREQAQDRLVAELRELDRLKDTFLANTSHELRTPLNGVMGLVESLLHDPDLPLDDRAKYKLRLVLQSTHRLRFLVNDILDFAVMHERGLNLSCRALNLHELGDVVLALAAHQQRGDNLLLRNEIPADLPAVWADENRLHQILLNLVTNALKYTTSGQVILTAHADDDMVTVSVRDTGPGIPEDQLESIFEAFHQSSEHAANPMGGAGLGLSIVKQLVNSHGGTVRASNHPEGGAVITFTLPVTDEQASPLDKGAMPLHALQDHQTSPAVATHTHPPQAGAILVVDDDATNLAVIEEHLRDYRLQQTKDPQAALTMILERQPSYDLVILDIMMPGLSGYDLCRRVREFYAPNDLPILMLTARNQVKDLIMGLEAGANDFLTKPISRGELQARVNTHLQLGRMTRNLREAQAQGLKNARAAGRAIFATSVLHNVGNILSSIKVSCQQVSQRLSQSKVTGLHMAGRMLADHLDNLPSFMTDDPKGKKLPEYFVQVSDLLKSENDALGDEVASMAKRLGLMEKVISSQQEMARDKFEPLILKDLVEESLAVQSDACQRHHINLVREYDFRGTVRVPQALTIHVLVNLIKNAIEAMADVPHPQLTIRTGQADDGTIFCAVQDNGEGIENLNQLFKRGVTTKRYGHGFGLHFCLETVESMGGQLKAESDGPGSGACFTIFFPTEPA